MSFSTELFCRITFIRATYNDLSDVEEEIEAAKRAISNVKREIESLVFMTEPDKMFKAEEGENVFDIITERLNQCFEILTESSDELFKLEHLKANWDACHDAKTGLAIPLPEGIDFDAAYLDGDYVRTIKNKNGCKLPTTKDCGL